MKKSYKIITLLLAVSICFTFTGCNKKGAGNSANGGTAPLDIKTKELRQNDYRGGVKRALALQTNVLKVMDKMKANNIIIRSDSPNSFWTADGYQDFVSTFLDTPIINDTQWFNEEETDWATIIKQISTTANSFTTPADKGYALNGGVTFTRNEKDDYSIDGTTDTIETNAIPDSSTAYTGKTNYRILYDCDKDWCKAYENLSIAATVPEITSQMFEYERINNNTFIIQTSKERLMVVLEPSKADIDIRKRKIKEFYYSKLVTEGRRTTFKPYVPLPETDSSGIVQQENIKQNETMATYPEINGEGDFSLRYGKNDSMFYLSPKEIKRNWVFEDKSLQQAIVYKDGILIVTTYNKLSTKYERFIYALKDADRSQVKKLEHIVVIDSLVGIQNGKTNDNTKVNDSKTAKSSDTKKATKSANTTAKSKTKPTVKGR